MEGMARYESNVPEDCSALAWSQQTTRLILGKSRCLKKKKFVSSSTAKAAVKFQWTLLVVGT